jgi:hypothetical protein
MRILCLGVMVASLGGCYTVAVRPATPGSAAAERVAARQADDVEYCTEADEITNEDGCGDPDDTEPGEASTPDATETPEATTPAPETSTSTDPCDDDDASTDCPDE